jgi:transglutaminase-like putative cysteine protease
MLYDITLKIIYHYTGEAAASRQMVRLAPAAIPNHQRLIASNLTVSPVPDEWINRTDYFGNDNVELAFVQPHSEISYVMQSRVERMENGAVLDISPGLTKLSSEIEAYRRLDAQSPHHFIAASPRVPVDDTVTAYAQDKFAGANSVYQIVTAIGSAIQRDMRYDSTATTVETPMTEAFENRHGVCQDFSHIMIAGLRGIGIPAGYVSGFLRTISPPNQPRLEGADAMHAWVRVWCGSDMGWVEYDPTNALLVDGDHIVVGYGRDYSDVAPITGVTRTAGSHSSEQYVDVKPINLKS